MSGTLVPCSHSVNLRHSPDLQGHRNVPPKRCAFMDQGQNVQISQPQTSLDSLAQRPAMLQTRYNTHTCEAI